MPELPEVETTRRGITPYLAGQEIRAVVVREHRLRWPVTRSLPKALAGQTVREVSRRGKYLLLGTGAGTAILHLGMSGRLCVVDADRPAAKHDHVDIVLGNGKAVRLTDPRRFGALLWTTRDPMQHRLLRELGPEPLSPGFRGTYLFERSRRRTVSIKSFLMDSHVVVGVGNIYANEALFMAGIHPTRAAGRIGRNRYDALAGSVKQVLTAAIRQGGTTLRDFLGGDGNPGYFHQELKVYQRAGLPCPTCGNTIRLHRLAQRSTFYCPRCQH